MLKVLLLLLLNFSLSIIPWDWTHYCFPITQMGKVRLSG